MVLPADLVSFEKPSPDLWVDLVRRREPEGVKYVSW
jgi:hypothetical protein